MPTIALASLAGRHNSSDDLMLAGTVRALREIDPAASLVAIVPNPDAIAGLLDADVRLVEAPMNPLQALTGSTGGPLRERRTTRRAKRLLEDALAGRDGVPEGIRASVEAIRSSDLLLYAGGGYLNALRPIGVHNAELLALAAARLDVPWALFGHSVGPFREAAPSVRVRRLLEGATAVGIRESRSAWEARSIAPRMVPDVTGDPSLLVPREAPGAKHRDPEWIGVHARDFNFRNFPSIAGEPPLSLGDAITMIAGRLKAEVVYIETAATPAHDDRGINERLDAMVLPSVRRGPPVRYSPGGVRLPPVSVVVAASYHVCLRALASGLPIIAVATSEYQRHKLRGLFELFERPEWVWTPEAGVPELADRAVSAAWDPRPERLLEIAAELADRQRAWLEHHVTAMATARGN
jgi:polysaccharide pyruvyl transferase WcaK-like protein